MHLPCQQADVGALPTDSSFCGEDREWKVEDGNIHAAILYPPSSILAFSELRETRPMHREKPHKLLQVGVTPTPATSLRSKRSESKAAAP
jgi:hypothetical protein